MMPNPVNISMLTKINKTQLHLLDCKNGNEGTLTNTHYKNKCFYKKIKLPNQLM
jgi:hypothetical protein